MRFALCVLAFSLLANPLVARAQVQKKIAAKTAAKAAPKERAPSNSSSFHVASFTCRTDDNTTAAMGLVHLGIDLKNNDIGFFGLTLYARLDKGNVATKVLNGAYTTVPGGYVLQSQWVGAPNDQVIIYLHAGDKTVIPGVPGKLNCVVNAQMDQL